jgi:hypothetical protein
MARPRINAVEKYQSPPNAIRHDRLTMDIALTFIGLHHKQVGHMTGNVILVTGGIATEHFLQTIFNVSKLRIGTRSGKHTLGSQPAHDHNFDA